jgi:hypothetical protein
VAKVNTDLEVPNDGILNNVLLTTPMGLTVATPLSINGTLTLNNGIVDIGTNNLIVTAIAGGNANSFVNTNGTGLFTLKNIGNVSSTLPVGYTSYSPIVLSNSGTIDDFSVNVAPGTICNAAALSSINRVWTLTEAVSGGSNVSVGLRWSAYLEGASFVRNSSAAVHCSGGAVDLKGSIGTATVTDTFYTQTITGISNFSPFGVTSDAATLPVHILNLSGKKLAFSNWLFWDASGEVNSSHYEVERSQSGNSFVSIGKIQSKFVNNSGVNTYQFEDKNPLNGIQYYRIKEVGNDLSLQYSSIVALQPNNKQSRFQVYPNPVEGRIIHLAIETAEPGIYHVGIYSLQGQLLQQKQLAVPIRNSLHHIVLQPQVMPGMYQFIITDAKRIVRKQLIFKTL